jgi:hypothetical protein
MLIAEQQRRGMNGAHGRDEVRNYWTRQWATVDSRVEPVEFSPGHKGEIVVEVHQIVRDLSGDFLADKIVGHTCSESKMG